MSSGSGQSSPHELDDDKSLVSLVSDELDDSEDTEWTVEELDSLLLEEPSEDELELV